MSDNPWKPTLERLHADRNRMIHDLMDRGVPHSEAAARASSAYGAVLDHAVKQAADWAAMNRSPIIIAKPSDARPE